MKKVIWSVLSLFGFALIIIGANTLWNWKIDTRIKTVVTKALMGFTNPTAQRNSGLALTGVATSTLTATQICSNAYLSIAPVTNTPTITTPNSSTMFAGCLPNIGAHWEVNYMALNTGTIFAPGAGSSILYSSSLTVAANKGARLHFFRDTALTYKVFLVNLPN